MSVLRWFLNANITLSNLLDSALPTRLWEDGNRYFPTVILPKAIQKNAVIYDFGGGSQPCIDRQTKEQYSITLTGMDISAEELNGAPLAGIIGFASVAEITLPVLRDIIEGTFTRVLDRFSNRGS